MCSSTGTDFVTAWLTNCSIFRQRFILVKSSTIVVTFFRITKLTLNRSYLNKVGQIGQIDVFDDMNCTKASEFLKNPKRSCHRLLDTLEIFGKEIAEDFVIYPFAETGKFMESKHQKKKIFFPQTYLCVQTLPQASGTCIPHNLFRHVTIFGKVMTSTFSMPVFHRPKPLCSCQFVFLFLWRFYRAVVRWGIHLLVRLDWSLSVTLWKLLSAQKTSLLRKRLILCKRTFESQ